MNRGSSSHPQSPPGQPRASLNNSAPSFAPKQLSLYRNAVPDPGSMNDESLIREIVTECIRKSNKSREQIGEEMTRLMGIKVTVRMLNSYTSEAAEQHRWPAQFTRAFCYVLEDWSLIRCMVERVGFYMITEEEAAVLELGRQIAIRKAADEAIAKIETKLRGIEL